MSLVCRECGWQGAPANNPERCPRCRTPFHPSPGRAGRDGEDARTAEPRASGTAPPPHAGTPDGQTPPVPPTRRTGSVLLGLALAGVVAVPAALVFAPGLRPSTGTASAAEEAPAAPATPSASTPPAPATPPDLPPAVVAREVGPYLPAGYALAGSPRLAAAPSPDGGAVYRVPLEARRTLYAVPVIPLRLAPDAPAALRENRASLVVHAALPPGRAYDLDGARAASRQGERVEGTWRVRLEPGDGAWRVADAAPVSVAGPGAGGGSALLTEAERAAAGAERREALERYAARARAVEREVEAFRAAALRDVPPPCGRDVAALLAEVVRLASDCPAIPDAAQRNACIQRRDRLNGEMGACERRNQLHEERSAAVRRTAAVRRGERLAAFARALAGEADAQRRRVGG